MSECYSCKTKLELPDGPVGRNEECPKCRNDVKVCLNCKFYDIQSYNECRESMAERVVDKDRRNFCDYFSLITETSAKSVDTKSDTLKKLNNLFKK